MKLTSHANYGKLPSLAMCSNMREFVDESNASAGHPVPIQRILHAHQEQSNGLFCKVELAPF